MEEVDDLKIEWVNSIDAVPSSLWEQCFKLHLEGRWWYDALEKADLSDQFEFSYGIILRGNIPVGIAPSFVMNVPIDLVMPPLIAWLMRTIGRIIKPLQYQRTLFIGSPCSDEGTVGLSQGIPFCRVLPAIQNSLFDRMREKKASIIVWKDFPDSMSDDFYELSKTHGLFKIVSFPGTLLQVEPGTGFSGYLKLLTSDKRNQIKRRLKKGRESGECECEIVQRPDEKTLKDIFGLFWQTYEKGKTKFERLNYKFFQNISKSDVSYYILLRSIETKKLVAFMLCFKLGDYVINKFVGIDYSLQGNWYLYFRLNEQAIDWASRSGAKFFQSGQTGYIPKVDMGHKLVPLTNYCKHRNKLMNTIFAFIAKRVTLVDLDGDLKRYFRSANDNQILIDKNSSGK